MIGLIIASAAIGFQVFIALCPWSGGPKWWHPYFNAAILGAATFEALIIIIVMMLDACVKI